MDVLKTNVLLAVLLLSGCSLRFDFTECKSSADCERLESPGELLQCVSSQCVPIPDAQCRTAKDCEGQGDRTECVNLVCVAPDPDNDMGMDSETDLPDLPLDADTDTDADVDVDMELSRPCTANMECADLGQHLCIEGYCESLNSADCQVVEVGEELQASRTVVLGAILPKTNYQDIGPPLEQAIRLAVKEANRAGGLADGTNVVLVSCDDQGLPAVARRAASFLTNTLKSPALVGPIFSESALSVFNNVAKDAGAMMMLPTASVPSLTTLIDDGLVFRTIPSDVLQARAFYERVRELQAQQARRIIVFVKDDAYGEGLSNQLRIGVSDLKTIVGASNVYFVSYPDFAPLNQAQREDAIRVAVETAQQQFPNANLMLGLGTTELALFLTPYYQAAGGPIETILSHGGAPALANIALASSGALTNTQIATAIGPNIFDALNYPAYLERFEREYPGTPPITISTLTYDATMAILLAMTGVPSGNVLSGANIAAAISRIADKDAQKISYGADPDFFSTARAVLQGAENIDYRGVSGEVDFDSNGDIRTGFLGFTAFQNPNNNQYELAPYRAFTLTTGNNGFWLTLCGGAPVAPSFATCSAGFLCVPVNAEGAQACLPECDLSEPVCPPATSCTMVGAIAAACVPGGG